MAALNASTWSLMATTPPMKRRAAAPRAGTARRVSLLKRALDMQSVAAHDTCDDRETDEAASTLFELSVSAGGN